MPELLFGFLQDAIQGFSRICSQSFFWGFAVFFLGFLKVFFSYDFYQRSSIIPHSFWQANTGFMREYLSEFSGDFFQRFKQFSCTSSHILELLWGFCRSFSWDFSHRVFLDFSWSSSQDFSQKFPVSSFTGDFFTQRGLLANCRNLLPRFHPEISSGWLSLGLSHGTSLNGLQSSFRNVPNITTWDYSQKFFWDAPVLLGISSNSYSRSFRHSPRILPIILHRECSLRAHSNIT